MSDDKHGLLPRFSVDRPVTVVMTLLSMLVLGFIAYTRIPVALFPEGYDQKNLMIFVSVPNATPSDVEETVARPIEEMVGTVSGVERIWSRSSSGSCFVRVTFQSEVDLQEAYAELRDRMDRVMPDMPDEVERINVRRWDENDIPIINAVVSVPEGVEDVNVALEQYVQPALQRIDGVGNVDIWGLRGRQVIVETRKDLIAAHGIDMSQLMSRLRGQDQNVPGGWVMEGGRKFYVRSLGRFSTIEEIENLVIDADNGLRLKDIATVSFRPPKQERIFRVDGRPSVWIEVLRSAGGNIVDISHGVRETLDQLKGLPQLRGLEFNVVFDQGEHVQEAINNLRNSGLWGGLFAAAILFAFLRAPRMTGIITLAIPLSLLNTVIVMYFMGWTLNMATMMGLLLSIGLVVDNSIVIVENIYRKRQEGVEPRRASIEGAGEVGLAVVMATLTTVVVFLPLILMGGGDYAFWMVRIGLPVIAALLASLFIALIFIPLAALRFSRGTKHEDLRIVSWVRRQYSRGLGWVLRHRLEAALLILLAMGSIVIPMNNMQRTDRGGGGEDTVRMFFDMPSGLTLERASSFMKSMEDQVAAHRDDYNIARVETRFWANNGRIEIARDRPPSGEWYMVAWNGLVQAFGRGEKRLTREEVEKDLKEKIQVPPGYQMRTSWRDGTEEAAASVALYGEDTETLVSLAGEVERRLATIPQVIEVDTEVEQGQQELHIQLDRDQARRLGVEPRAISSGISSTLRSSRLSQFRAPNGREVDVTVQLEETDTTSLEDVRRLSFRNSSGDLVPLESVAALNVTRALGQIRRENRQTSLRVTARAEQKDGGALFAAIDAAMAGFEMPRGYRWDKGDRWYRMQESDEARTFAMIMAISFVFLLMGVLFESFILPLAVIASVPFALLGVYWTLYLTGTPFDIMSGIGVVILVGVVVNNAIVLIDMVNRLRAEGLSRAEAILQAGRNRFRPILMTTFTTVCGLIPMALGDSRMVDIAYAPLGRTMIGGLLASTFLTLFIVPLAYTLLDDLRALAMRTAASAVAQPAIGAAEQASPER